jgi:hypothetical protein
MHAKMSPAHRHRAAAVYVRQSSGHQVRAHQESHRRQYGLAERARALGVAHVVILDEAAERFAHTHGEQVGAAAGAGPGSHSAGHEDHGAVATAFGPDIAFQHTFPAPGPYKVWGQFQAQDGQIITADFVVRVS